MLFGAQNTGTRPVPNRADKRAWARRWHRPSQLKRSAAGRKVTRPTCVHGSPLPYPWSAPEPHCKACAAATTARLAEVKRLEEEAELAAAEAVKKPSRRRRATPKEA